MSADIGKQQIAAVYAKALIGAAEKKGSTDEVIAELDSLVSDVLEKFPAFESTIGSPRLSPEEKNEMIDRVFGGKISDDLKTFLKVLCQHERLDCLREVRGEARRLLNELRNRTSVQVTTATGLSEQEKHNLVHELQVKLSCEVDLSHTVDESIIGGMIVRVGDKVIDGSIRNRLQQMRSTAIQKAVEQIHDSTTNSKFAS